MRVLLLCGVVVAMLVGCGRPCRDAMFYELSGRQKPIVAVLPTIDNSNANDLTWDLSREFTDEIRKGVYHSKRLYLLKEGSQSEIAKLLSTPQLQSIPQEVVDDLGSAQFVIVTELLEGHKTPAASSSNSKSSIEKEAILSLRLALRVLDIRHGQTKVVLQEILEGNFLVSKASLGTDYAKTPWGSEAFNKTPMGMAHNHLVKSLLARAEAYIEAAL